MYLQGQCCLRPCISRPCCNYVWLQKDFDPHCVQKACLLTWKILAIRQTEEDRGQRQKKQPGKDFTNRLFFLQKVGFSSVDILFALSTTGNPGLADHMETEGASICLFVCFFVCNRGDTIQHHGGLQSRELGQAPMLQEFLSPRQALSSHPCQQKVWLYLPFARITGPATDPSFKLVEILIHSKGKFPLHWYFGRLLYKSMIMRKLDVLGFRLEDNSPCHFRTWMHQDWFFCTLWGSCQ